jgi:hypothetical protein
VARELRTGRLERLWLGDHRTPAPPYDTGPDCLFVSYYASAELGCHIALGWPMPVRILDLCAEFRCATSGLETPCGRSLLGALAYHGLDGLDAAEKADMRDLALRGGDYTPEERDALLAYCQSDVDSLARLLPRMVPEIDLPRALLRGRYMAAAARIEWTGVPIDTGALSALVRNWDRVKGRLIAAVDRDYGVFVPGGRRKVKAPDDTDYYAGPLTFSAARWEEYLRRKRIAWPRLESGRLALDDETLKEMSRTHPDEVGPIRDVLRIHRGELKMIELTVGPDGRNRYLLSAFGSRTGRNQPSNTKSIFGPSVWLRSLIAPGPGQAVAYCDWGAQELAIAAALSGDAAMQEAYLSGDPYLWLARKAGAVPDDATKQSHPREREAFKVVSLGVLYGLSAEGIARKLGVAPCRGRVLLRMHQQAFRTFWKWSDQAEMEGMLTGRLRTVFGWRVHVGAKANPRSLRNFPMQANGAEMLRLACCLTTEAGITVCAPVHDALLVEAPARQIRDIVARTVGLMREASAVVLDGFEVRVDAKIVEHPDRFRDDRGRRMWDTVTDILAEVNLEKAPVQG